MVILNAGRFGSGRFAAGRFSGRAGGGPPWPSTSYVSATTGTSFVTPAALVGETILIAARHQYAGQPNRNLRLWTDAAFTDEVFQVRQTIANQNTMGVWVYTPESPTLGETLYFSANNTSEAVGSEVFAAATLGSLMAWNIGPHTLENSASTNAASAVAKPFTRVTTPADGKVLYVSSTRITGYQTIISPAPASNPTLPALEGYYVNALMSAAFYQHGAAESLSLAASTQDTFYVDRGLISVSFRPSLTAGGGELPPPPPAEFPPSGISEAFFEAAFAPETTFVQHIDGPIAIVSASPVSLLSSAPTTDTTTIVGQTLGGAMLNPVAAQGAQAFDSRRSFYSAGSGFATPSGTLAVNDVLVVSNSDPDETSRRDGFTKNYGMIYVTDTAPNPNSLAPAAIGWTGRTSLVSSVVDWDTKAAALPSYATPGYTFGGSASDLAGKARFNPAFAHFINDYLGYEDAFPNNWANYSGSVNQNYGEYMERELSLLSVALISNQFTATQKKEILIRLCSFGKQTYDSMVGAGISPPGHGGAHYLFSLSPLVLYLWATDNVAALDNLHIAHRTNQLEQPFIITADMVTNDFVAFGDPDNLADFIDKPYTWHRRRIAGVSGNSITIPTARGGIGGLQGDNSKTKFQNLIMTDGTLTATILGDHADLIGSNPITVTLDSNPGFTTSSVIWFEPPVPLVAGNADWCIRPYSQYPNLFGPSNFKSYRNQQVYAPSLMLAAALGQMRRAEPRWTTFEKYVEQCRSLTFPSASFKYPDVSAGTADRAMWDANWTAIKAVTQAS